MDYLRIIIVLLTVLLFNSCSQKACEPEKIYVKTKVPRLKTLYKVEPYQIKDFTSLDDRYYRVNKKELKKASAVSQRRIHVISFYERQNNKFNKEFK